MANGDNNTIYLKAFLAFLSTALMALFVWVWSAQATLTELSFKFDAMAADMAELKSDTETDLRQDEQLSKHWRLHAWARHGINELERSADKPLTKWPDLNP